MQLVHLDGSIWSPSDNLFRGDLATYWKNPKFLSYLYQISLPLYLPLEMEINVQLWTTPKSDSISATNIQIVYLWRHTLFV